MIRIVHVVNMGAALRLTCLALALTSAACSRPSAAQLAAEPTAPAEAESVRPVARTAYVSDPNGHDLYIYTVAAAKAPTAGGAQ